MKSIQLLQRIAAFSACLVWLLPTAVLAQQPVGSMGAKVAPVTFAKPLIVDAELAADGALYGKVVDAAGVGIPDANITLRNNSNVVTQATSQEGGLFRIAPLLGGTYAATVGDQNANIRCWTNKSAPPTAVAEVLLVSKSIARAQGYPVDSCTTSGCSGIAGCGCGSCGGGGGILGFLTNPWVIAAGIAAAIAIPLALDDDDAS